MNDMNDRGGKSRGAGRGGDKGQRRSGAGGGGGFRRRRVCKFRSEKIDYIDYKDVRLLMQFVPERGKIQPRRLSGTSAKWQRKLQLALKRARELALIPYVTD
jgi:small subunit ribosomal protein S18